MRTSRAIRPSAALYCAVAVCLAIVTGVADSAPFDLSARKSSHWAWQPVKSVQPPQVSDEHWATTPVDRFILAGLEKEHLTPAAPADRATLLRRTSFAIIGLPPTPEEIDAFVKDASPDAFEKVVDRLLASPRFGERWARHWMDLVRYADTLGNESDAPIPNAWRYRDYLIRAFNADVPYNQLVTEHIAGDRLKTPRRDPATGNNESIIASGFFWMNEGKRSPVDVRAAQADCFDNKIDVMCKTFLGLTVGCARCHDHKFDAISQADYYALYGYLKSSRYTQALVNDEPFAEAAKRLAEAKANLRQPQSMVMLEQSANLSKYLLATVEAEKKPIAEAASDAGLSAARLQQWVGALKAPIGVDHPLYLWQRIASKTGDVSVAPEWKKLLAETNAQSEKLKASNHRKDDVELSEFLERGYKGWFSEDQSFGSAPSMPGDFLPGNTVERPIATFFRDGAWAHSGTLCRKLQGTLRSPTFTINRRYLHVFCAGRQARVNVNIQHYVMIQDPLYGGLRFVPDSDGGVCHTVDLGMWKGQEAYVEFADTTTPDLHDSAPKGIGKEGYLAVGRVLLSNDQAPPTNDAPLASLLFAKDSISSAAELAQRYQAVVDDSLKAFGKGELSTMPNADARAQLLSWLLENGLLDGSGTSLDNDVRGYIGEIFGEMKQIEASLPEPERAPATIDGTPEDEHVFMRGNAKTLGPLSPRRMLEAIDGDHQPAADANSSGRLELARRFVDPGNPLTARVMVNRVWHHLMGRGIVASVDNFGELGDRPSHPELLDYLANEFVKDGWSIKRLIRRIVLTNTFQMASEASAETDQQDPNNVLLHRANIRRLEGEAIRDEILQISGRLDAKMYGPGIEIHMTPFLDGGYIGAYGKPNEGGPLDGDGRRSVYMMVRRNFRSPMMVAFDTPPPINTAGRRDVSNVPAQALIMMNDPFVQQQAQLWAKRILANEGRRPEQRIERMYREAFGRMPARNETDVALNFLNQHGEELGIPADKRSADPANWSDLAHVLMNVKEFVFVN